MDCSPPGSPAHGIFSGKNTGGGFHFLLQGNLLNSGIESISLLSPALEVDSLPVDLPGAAAAAKSLQSCPTLCNPIDGSPPGSSVHGIFQARVLESGAIAFSELPGEPLIIL